MDSVIQKTEDRADRLRLEALPRTDAQIALATLIGKQERLPSLTKLMESKPGADVQALKHIVDDIPGWCAPLRDRFYFAWVDQRDVERTLNRPLEESGDTYWRAAAPHNGDFEVPRGSVDKRLGVVARKLEFGETEVLCYTTHEWRQKQVTKTRRDASRRRTQAELAPGQANANGGLVVTGNEPPMDDGTARMVSLAEPSSPDSPILVPGTADFES